MIVKAKHYFLVSLVLFGLVLLIALLPSVPHETPVTGASESTAKSGVVESAEPHASNENLAKAGSSAGQQDPDSAPAASTLSANSEGAEPKAKDAASELKEIFDKATLEHLEKNVRPIAFHGIVINQNGAPVESAVASFSAYQLPTDYALSDSTGRFSLTGGSGKYLSVRVSKEGFLNSRSNLVSFDYAPELPGYLPFSDPATPVVFRLYKKGPGVDLVTSRYGVNRHLGVSPPADGSPVRVDFFNREVGESGQMEVIKTTPARDGNRGAKEWRLRLSLPDGGFVAHDDEFPFEAPATGYQPTLEFHFTPGDPNWTDTVKGEFYIAFGNPRRYGRIRVGTAMYNGIRLEYAINPDGSRYLEPKEKEY